MNLEPISHRQSQSGKYIIDGMLCEELDGTRSWRVVVTSPTSGHDDDHDCNLVCIIQGEDLRCFEVGVRIPDFEVLPGKAVEDVEPSVKAAIMESIQCWEHERRNREAG